MAIRQYASRYHIGKKISFGANVICNFSATVHLPYTVMINGGSNRYMPSVYYSYVQVNFMQIVSLRKQEY